MSQEYYQGGVCEGNLWMINSSSQNLFRTSPCSSSINDIMWSNLNLTMMNMEAPSKENNNGDEADISQKITQQDFCYSSMSNHPHELSFISNTFQDSSNDPLKTHQQAFVVVNNNNPIATSPLSVNNASAPSYDYSSSVLLQNLFDMSSPTSTIHEHPSSGDNNNLAGWRRSSSSQTMSSVPFPTSDNHSYGVAGNDLEFSYSNTVQPYWRTSSAVTCDVGASVLSSTQHHKPQFIAPSVSKPKLSSFAAKRNGEVKKAHNEASLKRSKKTETSSSPLPTFNKVRKEKLGDRITALQQLVSPFGKTDTASVLHETIEYIKFLHDQVRILSTPYMKNASPPRAQYQQMNAENNNYKKDQIGQIQQPDLRSRGLCLVPISTTFPVASETPNII